MIKPISTSVPLQDDWDLLKLMLDDANKVDAIYQPGPYWKDKTKAAVNELKQFGLSDFRGSTNGAATSYGDNAFVDSRCGYNYGIRSLFLKIYRDLYPFNRLFDTQVTMTKQYFEEAIYYRTHYLKSLDRVQFLLSNYTLPPDTTKGGCLGCGDFGGKVISHHYLQLLDTLDNVLRMVDIQSRRSFFEIGGGFGANLHLMLELVPNIRKVVYLDIPPNLYVGTQYLKSFFGEGVIDYRKNRDMDRIVFSEDETLEIFCITPAQIEKIGSAVDLFHNAHSFVEMPLPVVKNYAQHIDRVLSKNAGVISLVSYDEFDLSTTFHPDLLATCFARSFEKRMVPNLTPGRSNYHFTSR